MNMVKTKGRIDEQHGKVSYVVDCKEATTLMNKLLPNTVRIHNINGERK